MGADCPGLSASQIVRSLNNSERNSGLVIGPSEDGGFYLFAGSRPISEAIWCSVTYSQDDTLSQLERALEASVIRYSIEKKEVLYDIDTATDWHRFQLELSSDN